MVICGRQNAYNKERKILSMLVAVLTQQAQGVQERLAFAGNCVWRISLTAW